MPWALSQHCIKPLRSSEFRASVVYSEVQDSQSNIVRPYHPTLLGTVYGYTGLHEPHSKPKEQRGEMMFWTTG